MPKWDWDENEDLSGVPSGWVRTVSADGTATWQAPATSPGGSVPGVSIVRRFPFAFDTASLTTGAPLYTPTVNDILIDGWVEIVTAWDGTTPQGDVFSGTHVAAQGTSVPTSLRSI